MTHSNDQRSPSRPSPQNLERHPNLERPRFKSGVRLYASSATGITPESPTAKRYFVGTRRVQCELDISNPRAIFHLLSQGATLDEIATASESAIGEAELLIQRLTKDNLLETKVSAIELSQRFISAIAEKAQKGSDRSKDGAYLQLADRIAPELSISKWIPGVEDSGVAIVSKRQSAHIEISGDSRSAHQLFGILLASGLTHTRIAPSHTRKSNAVEERDISAGFLRGSDIGAPFNARMDSISKELTLFPMDKLESAEEIEANFHEQTLKIHFGDIDPEVLARWMSLGQDHLIVSEIDGAMISVGPLVLPGKTPCSRCLSLTLDQPMPDAIAIFDRDVAPSAATHYLAGLIGSLVLQLIDTGKSDLIGSVLIIDLLSICNTEHITIPRHPMCGCSW